MSGNLEKSSIGQSSDVTAKEAEREKLEKEIAEIEEQRKTLLNDLDIYFLKSTRNKLNRLAKLIGKTVSLSNKDGRKFNDPQEVEIEVNKLARKMQEKIKIEREKLQTLYDKEVSRLNDEFEKNKEKIEKEFNDKITKLREEHDTETQQQLTLNELTLEQMSEENESSKRTIQDGHAIKVKRIKDKYEEDMQKLNDGHQSEIITLQSDFRTELEGTKNKLKDDHIANIKKEEEKNRVSLNQIKEELNKELETFVRKLAGQNEFDKKELILAKMEKKGNSKKSVDELRGKYLMLITTEEIQKKYSIIFPFLSQLVSIAPYYFILKHKVEVLKNDMTNGDYNYFLYDDMITQYESLFVLDNNENVQGTLYTKILEKIKSLSNGRIMQLWKSTEIKDIKLGENDPLCNDIKQFFDIINDEYMKKNKDKLLGNIRKYERVPGDYHNGIFDRMEVLKDEFTNIIIIHKDILNKIRAYLVDDDLDGYINSLLIFYNSINYESYENDDQIQESNNPQNNKLYDYIKLFSDKINIKELNELISGLSLVLYEKKNNERYNKDMRLLYDALGTENKNDNLEIMSKKCRSNAP